MLNEAIVGQLFAIFKEQYGYAVDDAAGVFDGQRDMLEFLMRLGKSLERNERAPVLGLASTWWTGSVRPLTRKRIATYPEDDEAIHGK